MSSESPPTLESEECHKLLDTLLSNAGTSKKQRKSIRNYCMAMLMLDAGLRVGELVSLRMSDLYFNREPVRTLFIKSHMTKNKVEHSIPVSKHLSESLISYSTCLNCLDPERGDDFAFPRACGDKPISTRQVERIICAAGWKSFGRPVHPHVLRHTFASRLMRVTNSSMVQRILGHKYLTSTQIYCHPNEDDKRQAIDLATVQPDPELSSEHQQLGEPHPPGQQGPGAVPASPVKSQPASHW